MTGRRIFTVLLAALLTGVLLAAAGCATGLNSLKQTKDGRLEYPVGSDMWTWGKTGGKIEIQFNGKPYALIENGQAMVSLSDGRSIDVMLDRSGSPVSVKTSWGTALSQDDYTQINTAIKLNQMANGQRTAGPWGWAVVALLVALLGVLAQIKAGAIVDWAKAGGIFTSFDTARTLLIVRAASILVIAAGAIWFLAAVF